MFRIILNLFACARKKKMFTKIQIALNLVFPTCISQLILDFECKLLRLDGEKTDLSQLTNQSIHNSVVALINYRDIHSFANSPVFYCTELFLEHCDKNFLRYWLKEKTFPNLKTVFIRSHPGDWYVLNNTWIKQKKIKVHLSEHYFKYCANMSCFEESHIKEISNYEYDIHLERFVISS